MRNLTNSGWAVTLCFVIVVYLLSQCIMLFIPGAWWDDMVLWNYPNEKLIDWERDYNNPFQAFIINQFVNGSFISLESRMLLYRFFPFISGLVIIVSIYFIIKKITNNILITFYTSLIAATSCIDKTSILVICSHYTGSSLLFFVGLVFFVFDFYNEKLLYKWACAILWGGSLLIWSKPFFVIIFCIVVASGIKTDFHIRKLSSYICTLKSIITNYWMILMMVVAFLFMYKTVLSPQGEYAKYYSMNYESVLLSPLSSFSCSLYHPFLYLQDLFSEFKGKMILFIPLSLILIFILRRFERFYVADEKMPAYFNLLLLSFGFLFFSFFIHMLNVTLFYIELNSWLSRFASLTLLPLSLAYALLIHKYLYKCRAIFLSVFLSLSFLHIVHVYLGYLSEWTRNESIATYLKKNDYLDGKKIMFVNSPIHLKAFDESDRDYELDGCARLAFGENSKTKFFNYLTDSDKEVDYYMSFLPNKDYSKFHILYAKFFNPIEYREIINNLLLFSISPKFEYGN